MSQIIAQSFFHYWRFRHNIVSLQGSTLWGIHTVYFLGFAKDLPLCWGIFLDCSATKRETKETCLVLLADMLSVRYLN